MPVLQYSAYCLCTALGRPCSNAKQALHLTSCMCVVLCCCCCRWGPHEELVLCCRHPRLQRQLLRQGPGVQLAAEPVRGNQFRGSAAILPGIQGRQGRRVPQRAAVCGNERRRLSIWHATLILAVMSHQAACFQSCCQLVGLNSCTEAVKGLGSPPRCC